MGASVEITVEIEVEMIPTGNLVVKEVAGWAKAEFTPEQLLAAVKKWASCVRDHAAHKATKKEVWLPYFQSHIFFSLREDLIHSLLHIWDFI